MGHSLFSAPSHAHLKSADRADIILMASASLAPDRTPGLDKARLRSAMEAAAGGSDADGAWSWRDAYEAVEAAQTRFIQDAAGAPSGLFDTPLAFLLRLQAMTNACPTQSVRSGEQIDQDQFSTPAALAALTVLAARIDPGETVLEPSAGTGLLAAAAYSAGADLVLNEKASTRRKILAGLFPNAQVHGHDGALIHVHVGLGAVDVALMNPPFSRLDAHLSSALQALRPNGRCVAITPDRFSAAQADALARAAGARLVFRLQLPQGSFAKHGTGIDVVLLVFDRIEEDAAMIGRRAASLEAAVSALAGCPPRRRIGPAITADRCRRLALQRRTGRRVTARFDTPIGMRPLAICAQAARDRAESGGLYATYRPARIDILDAQPHAAPLVESAAMAAVSPPDVGTPPFVHPDWVRSGALSIAQLETLCYAVAAHSQMLDGARAPSAEDPGDLVMPVDGEGRLYRKGFFLGDGTGCGKGRQVAALLMHNLAENRRRAVWFSKSATLIEDARRDWSDLGGRGDDIVAHSRWKQGDAIALDRGCLFSTYTLLRQPQRGEKPSRLDQLIEWLGEDFDGVIVFDECHELAGAGGGQGTRGAIKPSDQGRAALTLQNRLPNARILYVSATGASRPENLAYATRLGLWTFEEACFPGRADFVAAMEQGGVAAMEVVARDLKAMGLYIARALSFEGVEYAPLEHEMSEGDTAIWDAWADAFQIIHTNLARALETTGIDPEDGYSNGQAKAAARSAFESAKQRFFAHLLLSLKTPSLIRSIRSDLDQGECAVVQITSTNEAVMNRRLDAIDPAEWDDLTMGFTPKEYVLDYLQNSWPVIQYVEGEDEEGHPTSAPLTDEEGNLVINPAAEALRAEMMDLLCGLPELPGALDQILHHFGTGAVAEVTGRSRRVVRTDGRLHVEPRPASANLDEARAFMAGEKNILVFSQAGGTGRSYHADLSARNQRRRNHYLAEPGWRAEAAIQGLGRTHRTHQASAPRFHPVSTNVKGEKRFLATIARRLDALGALTRGERKTGGQNLFRPEDNLESPYANAALRAFYHEVHAGRAPMSLKDFEEKTALRLTSVEGFLLEDLPRMSTFLNRVLALRIADQNMLFDCFDALFSARLASAEASGQLDTGIEALSVVSARQMEDFTLRTCPKTGATTRAQAFEIETRLRKWSVDEMCARAGAGAFFVRNDKSGRVGLADEGAFDIDETGALTARIALGRPTGWTSLSLAEFAASHWRRIEPEEAKRLWTRELADLPETETRRIHMICGLLLPIWTSLPRTMIRVRRLKLDNGETFLGRVADAETVRTLAAAFGGTEGPALSASEIVEAVMARGASFSLTDGARLKRARVMNADRLEILPGATAPEALLQRGARKEIIAWTARYFIPLATAETVLGSILVLNPLAQAPGGRAA